MLNKIKSLFVKKPEIVAQQEAVDLREKYKDPKKDLQPITLDVALEIMKESSLQRTVSMDLIKPAGIATTDSKVLVAMDLGGTTRVAAMDQTLQQLKVLSNGSSFNISPGVISFFSSQGFIGYQLCGILAQHWLIEKACLLPAKDAMQNGYLPTVNDGSDVPLEALADMKLLDVEYNINKNLIELENKCRIFGIRIAIFKVNNDDPDYYKLPFNIDSVKPGTYKGIAQVDPYWCAPLLDTESASDPSSIHFYNPTYWIIGGKTYHRTHLIVIRTNEPADILKPSYLYGGIPKTQQIYEKVYNSERSANEIPRLVMNKRCKVIKTDLSAAATNQQFFDEVQSAIAQLETNFSVRVIDKEDDMELLDTSLAELDTAIMTSQQLVAAVAQVPAVKLFESEPKGFQSTGSFSVQSYNQTLIGIQCEHMTPFLAHHYKLLIRSEICPKYKIAPFDVQIVWNPLLELDGKEQAEVNKLNSDTALQLITAGILDPEEARSRLIADAKSGYSGIPEAEDLENDLTGEEDEPEENS